MAASTEATAPKDRRDTTINVRLSARTRDLIDSAAELRGKSRSEFILESAREQAIDVLLDQRLFTLDPVQYEAFVAALDEPPPTAEALRTLLARRAPWEA